MKGGTGIYLDANDKDAFQHFLQNSTLSFSSASGSFGITYILTLNPDAESKYLSLDASNYSKPVKQILLKTTFVYPVSLKIDVFDAKQNRNSNKTTTTVDNFYEEVNIQTDAYLRTMEYLQPLCPAILYANALDVTDPTIAKITSTFDNNLMNQMRGLPGIKIGFIAMELMDNAMTVYEALQEKAFYESYIAKVYYTLIEFIMKTGYNHGDFHFGNMLLNLNVTDYFFGKRGQATLIDFGYTQKLSQKNYSILKEFYKEKRYVEILDKLCDIPRKDGYIMDDFAGYTNTCLRTSPELADDASYVVNKEEINNKIAELYGLREKSIDVVVNKMGSLGINLPLSNSAKNQMYNGNIPNKKVVNEINAVVMIRDLDVREFLDDIIQIVANDYKIKLINVCYMYTYLLNIQFPDESDKNQRVASLIYSGIFDGYDYDSICQFVSQKFVPKMNIQTARTLVTKIIDKYSFLENIHFNTFASYIPKSMLQSLIPENELVQLLGRNTTYLDPIALAEELKKNKQQTNVNPRFPFKEPRAAKKRKLDYEPEEMQLMQRFQELPFSESGGKKKKPKKTMKKRKRNKYTKKK